MQPAAFQDVAYTQPVDLRLSVTMFRTLAPHAALLLALFLGACGSGPAPDAGEDETGSALGATLVATPPPPGAAPRSLEAPPDLQVGEWWSVEVDPELVGVTIPTTLVVTRRDEDVAGIGIPPQAFSHDFLVLHMPILGDLDLRTFAWRVMWDDFEALRFPLEEGRTWTSDFHGQDVDATVTRVEGNRAWVSMTGESEQIELVYDADVGMITDFRESRLRLAFRVTDHGFGYRGRVLDLAGIELGLMASPPAAAAASSGPPGSTDGTHEGHAASTATFEVETAGPHGSLSLVLWGVGSEGEPGRYRIVATAPDGTVFEQSFDGSTGPGPVVARSSGHDAVTGRWQVDFERDGPAGLLVELFTYDLNEVEMGGS